MCVCAFVRSCVRASVRVCVCVCVFNGKGQRDLTLFTREKSEKNERKKEIAECIRSERTENAFLSRKKKEIDSRALPFGRARRHSSK